MFKIYDEILENLIQYEPSNEKIRWGHNMDGGYVVVSDYDYDCFISAGIADEITFEQDFIKHNPNTHCYAFDGTVDRPDALPQQFKYVRKNIGAMPDEFITDLSEYVLDYNDIFLKFDIEGTEWSWIPSFENHLHRCKQIVFEAHAIYPTGVPGRHRGYYETSDGAVSEEEWLRNILLSLRILNKTHRLVHAHQNADAPYVLYDGKYYPTFLELTFLRKDCDADGLNKTMLPIPSLDYPSGRTDPDMLLKEGAHYDPFFYDRDMSFYPFVDEREIKTDILERVICRISYINSLYEKLGFGGK